MDVIQRHGQSQLSFIFIIIKALIIRARAHSLILLLIFASLTHAQAIEKPLEIKNTVSSHSNLLNTETQRVLVIGDSISAAFGLNKSKGWVALLDKASKGQYKFINASISGDTTSGGRYRLGKSLAEHQPHWVIIELGGNDGLRGTPLKQIRLNLIAMINEAQQSGAQVMLLGMRIPPNYGERYTTEFAAIYTQLSEQFEIAYVPFFLEGVAGVAGMMQEDGIHPTEAAQSVMMEHVKRVFDGFIKP